jgi:hypothetical protein
MTLAVLISLVSGGLAGGFVSAIFNRIFHWRALRTQFYPKLNNMYSAYVIRFAETPNGRGRYWVNIVGNLPSDEDEEFVNHRADFIAELIAFNELKEARRLRQAILDNSADAESTPGLLSKLDLQPEFNALDNCMKILHKKLKLDKR